MHSIFQKLTLVDLSVCQKQSATALLRIVFELTLVLYPLFVQFVKISEIESSLEFGLLIIVHDPCTIELVIFPLSLVSYRAVRVVEYP